MGVTLLLIGLIMVGVASGIAVDRLFGKRISDMWHARQRRIDIEILWPTCKRQASDLDHARAAFMMHAAGDEAWLSLGRAEMLRRIGGLK